MKSSIARPQPTSIHFVCAMLLWVACTGPSTERSRSSLLSVPGRSNPSDSMHVLDSTLKRTMLLFGSTFAYRGSQPVLFSDQEVPYDSLLALAPKGEGAHGLQVEYGLSGDTLRFAFQFVPLDTTGDPNVFTYTLGDTVLDWSARGFTAWNRQNWIGTFQNDPTGPGGYLQNMTVKRSSGGAFVPLDTLLDARSLMLAWELEMVPLHEQNKEHPDSTLSAIFCSVAQPDGSDSLRHGIVVHMRARPKAQPSRPGRDLIDNSYVPKHLLHMHGADFGTRCPPNCNTYFLPPM